MYVYLCIEEGDQHKKELKGSMQKGWSSFLQAVKKQVIRSSSRIIQEH
jgi:hypothetical protein